MQKFSVISNYLISGPVSPDSVAVHIGLGLAGGFFVAGLLALVFVRRLITRRPWANFVDRLGIMARWGGGLLFVALFLQNQDMEPFDMRLWVVIIAFPLLGYLVYSLREYRKKIPISRQENNRYDAFEKYLPGSVKKK
jgi:hypothetical protein